MPNGVKIDAVERFLGAAKGTQQLLMRATEHAKNKEKAEQARLEHEQKKTNFALNKLSKGVTIPEKFQEDYFKSAFADINAAGITINPGLEKMFKDEGFRQDWANSAKLISGLSAEEQAGIPILATMTASDISEVPNHLKTISSAYTQQQKVKSQQFAQVEKQKALRTKTLTDTQAWVGKQFKNDIEVINRWNDLSDIAAKPENRRAAVAGDTAKVMLSKIFDPEGVVRQGEIERLRGLSSGFLDKANLAVKRTLKGEELTEAQWFQVMSITNIAADNARANISRGVESRKSIWEPQGLERSEVVGFAAPKKDFAFGRQFGREPLSGAGRGILARRPLTPEQRVAAEHRITLGRKILAAGKVDAKMRQDILNSITKLEDRLKSEVSQTGVVRKKGR